MIAVIIIIAWLSCAAFNVYGFSRMFEYLPVTLTDVVLYTVLAPAVFFFVLAVVGSEVVVIKSRK